eukprot:Skav230936  [mRNA]  locus=scaffold2774:123856:125157:- [translate_table: standard]
MASSFVLFAMWSHMATGARASMAVGLQGDYAYFAQREFKEYFSFSVVDISDPTNPWVVASLLDNQDQLGGLDMAIQGSYAYLVGDRLNSTGFAIHLNMCDLFLLRVVSIFDPTNPVIVHTMQLPNATLADNECSTSSGITIVDDYAYVVGSFGLAVVDISDPTDPVIAWLGLKPALSQYRYNGITILGDYAYISGVGKASYTSQCSSDGYNWYPCTNLDWGYGLTVVNISDPSTPRLTGRVHEYQNLQYFSGSGSFFTANIAIVGDYAYLALQNVLRVFNISDPSRPHVCYRRNHVYALFKGMVVVEGHACFAFGSSRWSSWSCFTKASKASSCGSRSVDVDAWALGPAVALGDYAYIAIPPGVAVYNISAPTNWIFVGSTPTTTRTSSTITTVTATATTTSATFDENAAQAVATSALAFVLGVIAHWQHCLA